MGSATGSLGHYICILTLCRVENSNFLKEGMLCISLAYIECTCLREKEFILGHDLRGTIEHNDTLVLFFLTPLISSDHD